MVAKKFRLSIRLFSRDAKTSFRNQYFTLKSAPNNLSYCRLGVIISQRIFKSAVRRNRLKRRILDFFRLKSVFLTSPSVKSAQDLEINQEDSRTGKDLLIIVNPSIINLIKEDKDKDLEIELEKLRNYV